MTRQKHFKQLVRERMQKTGERYAAARRQIISSADSTPPSNHPHLPGTIPLVAALRILLTQAGVRDSTGKPLSEALTFGVAGGIGCGTFAFYYDSFSSFYVAGRHLWYDDVQCLRNALTRLGLTPIIKEFGGAGPAEKGLATLLKAGPAIAWVDMGTLPHRGMPPSWSGGGYHLVTVYEAEPGGEALIGDLADDPVNLATRDLTLARGRIKKDKYRLLALPASNKSASINTALKEGFAACATGLVKGRIKNFTIASLSSWAEALHGSQGKESWDRMFPPGPRLWRGLTSIYEFIEHFGTGGGLMRPLFAQTLHEAGRLLNQPEFERLAEGYAKLGRLWSELAEAALPGDFPAFAEVRCLLSRKEELHLSGSGSTEEVIENWRQIETLGERSNKEFPLSEAQSSELRKALKAKVNAIYLEEVRLAELLSKVA